MAGNNEAEFLEDEVVDEAVEESTGREATDQPEQGQPGRKPVQLDELPEFREWKRKADQRVAQSEKAAKEARDRAIAQEQRMAALEHNMKRQQLERMTEPERKDFAYRESQEQLQAAQQRLYQIQVEQSKRDALARMSELSGASIDELMKANNADEAWEMAVQHLAKHGKPGDETKRKRNKADLGQASQQTIRGDDDEKARLLRKNKDAVGLFKHALSQQRSSER